MLLLRWFLIFSLMLHPFCGHCLAEMRSMIAENRTPLILIDYVTEADGDSTPKQMRCSKMPYVLPTQIDFEMYGANTGILRLITLPTISWEIYTSSFVQSPQALYLRLLILLI